MFHHHYLCRGAINQENVVGGREFRLDLLYGRHRCPSPQPLFRHERQVFKVLLPWYFGGAGTAATDLQDDIRGTAQIRPPWNTACADDRRPESFAMSTSDGAYTLASISATMALFRALIKKGVLTRDDAVRAILDEAVARAIQGEAEEQDGGYGRSAGGVNRQSAEILKFLADKL